MKYELNFSVSGEGNPYPIDYGGESGQYVIKSDHSFWLWGQYPYTNESWIYLKKPTKLADGIISAATGDVFIAIVKEDNSLWCKGQNSHGQLGLGHTDFVDSATKVTDNVKCVAADNHMLVLKNDGTVWSCGYNACGQLGNGNTAMSATLFKVPIEDVDTVAAAFQMSAAIKKDGSLWAWGRGDHLGTGGETDVTSPVKIMSDVKYVSLCSGCSFAIKKDNSLWYWGYRETPKKIMDDVIYVDNGNYRYHVIKTDGKLYSWGQNDYGQLGDGTKNPTGWGNSYDKARCVLEDVQKVNVSLLQATGAMKTDGSIWTWGTNTFYSLGYGENDFEQLTPRQLIEGQSKELIEIEELTFAFDEIDARVGERIAVPLVISPCNANYSNISYTIDNPSVATISNKGVVTAQSCGTTNIRALVTDINGIEYEAYYVLKVSDHYNSIEPNYDKNNISIQGYYDINGRKQSKLQRGLNIIRYSDGSARKVFVK